MNIKKNVLSILITICFVLNSVVLFASNVVDGIENPADSNDPPPGVTPINDFIIPMIILAVFYVGHKNYKKNLVKKSITSINL